MLNLALIACMLLWLASLIPAMGVVIMAPMLFDAPGSEYNRDIWRCFNGLIRYPLVVLGSCLGGAALLWLGHPVWGLLLQAAPMLHLIYVGEALSRWGS